MAIEKFNSLELQMEVLSGCAFKCRGCHVDKDTSNKVTEKLYRVAEEFITELHPFSAVLGSTDIFTANNSLALLRDPRFSELLRQFDRLVVNSTMIKLDPEVVEAMAELGVGLQVNMVVPEQKQWSERYNEVIAERVGILKQTFPELVMHPQLNLSETLMVANYEALNDFYFTHHGQGVDFNLSFARSQRDPARYRSAFAWMREVFSTTRASIDGNMSGQHVDVVSPHDSLERAIIFYENEFYAIPIVYDDVIQIRERYRFTDYADYKRRYDELITEQLEYAAKTEECASCEFLFTCMDHKTLAVMEDYGIRECVLPKATIKKVNGWV